MRFSHYINNLKELKKHTGDGQLIELNIKYDKDRPILSRMPIVFQLDNDKGQTYFIDYYCFDHVLEDIPLDKIVPCQMLRRRGYGK